MWCEGDTPIFEDVSCEVLILMDLDVCGKSLEPIFEDVLREVLILEDLDVR